MSTAMIEVISQLNNEEQEKVIDYAKKLIFIRGNKSIKNGYDDFLLVRNEAENRNTPDLTLDEINDLILKTRKEMHKKEVLS